MILTHLNQFRAYFFIALIFTSITFLSCENNTQEEEVVLFEAGTINPTASISAIKAGETIDFSSNSTKVQSLNWTFQGGNPATSSEENVTVAYSSGGSFQVKLVVKYIDNLTETKTFNIEVEAPPAPVIPAIEGLGIYTERLMTASNPGLTPVNNGNMSITEVLTGAYNGDKSLFYHFVPTSTTSGFGLSLMAFTTSPLDATTYNFLHVALKSSTSRNVRIRLNTNSGNYWVILKPAAPAYGMLWDGAWHALKIPLSDILSNGTGASLSATAAAKSTLTSFVMRTDDADYSIAVDSWDFYVDDIYLTVN